MTWEEALQYESVVKEMASEWAYRVSQPDIREDLETVIYIDLVEKVNLSKVERDKDAYVKACCWKICEKYLRPSRKDVHNLLSLDHLGSIGCQLDEDGNFYQPGSVDIGGSAEREEDA